MDARVLVAGEADVAELARLPRLEERRVGAVVVEDAVRILVADDLVVLDQVDAVGLQAAQGLVELPGGFFFERPSILVIRKTLLR